MNVDPGRQVPGWASLARGSFFVAMAMFLVTIAIGIINGLDLVDFSGSEMRPTLLTHVHSGTLGWITLGVLAASMWLTRTGSRGLAWAFGILIPVYVAAFFSGNLIARAVTGIALLIAVLWLFVWIWRVVWRERTLPKIAVAMGLTTFTYGAIIGVLLQIQLATATTLFPASSDSVGAHAATMVFSYLVLTAMGLIEWQVRGTSDMPRSGLAQLLVLFVGGLILVLTLLFGGTEAVQAVGGIYLLFELVAVILFAIRILPPAVRTDWRIASARRFMAASAIWVIVAMLIFMYVVVLFISTPNMTPETFPAGILIASDHSVFIGVMTNLLLALVLRLAADRASRWSAAAQVAFWGINLGLVIFIVGLVADVATVKRVGAPLMGLSILLGLAVAAMRLRESDLSSAEATPTS